jgi:hypothetical protein
LDVEKVGKGLNHGVVGAKGLETSVENEFYTLAFIFYLGTLEDRV